MRKLLLLLVGLIVAYGLAYSQTKKNIIYYTLTKTMATGVDCINDDAVLKYLKADPNLSVTVSTTSSTTATSTIDFSSYDAIVIQESWGSTHPILLSTGALALTKITKPCLYNKTYAFKTLGNLATSSSGAGAEGPSFTMEIPSSKLLHVLFTGLTPAYDGASYTLKMFNALTTDLGTNVSGAKTLNYNKSVLLSDLTTLIGYPTSKTTSTDSISISLNDIPAGTIIGGAKSNAAVARYTTQARIITFNMNFGAICYNKGKNITDDNITLWRNAVYSLAGLDIPTTPVVRVTSVTLSVPASTISTYQGTLQLTPTVTPSNAWTTAVSWTVSNSAVATIDANGLLTAVGNGSVIVTASAVDGSYSAVSTTIVVSKQSNDATLKALTVNGTAVSGFTAASTTVNYVLPIGTTSLPTVGYTTNYTGSTSIVTQATALPGAATISVTAESSVATALYTINFTVAKSSDATLSSISVNGTPIDGFAAASNTIDYQLAYGVKDVPVVTATVNQASATATIAQASTLPGTASILVTAEDGSTQNYTVNFIAAKLVPTVIWNTPAPITYGTQLSSVQLNATASVSGVFTYTPASNTILNAGSNTLKVVFVPDDATNYASVSAEVTLVVNKSVPTITWSTPDAIAYGTLLSASQLNATSVSAGVKSYTPAAGAKLDVGTHTLQVDIAESSNYLAASYTVTLVVNKAVPSISWSTPASIIYGVALSSTQLNATSVSSGTITYTPGVGEKLDAGTHTLQVDIAESGNYLAASYTVQLIVSKAKPIVTWNTPSAIPYKTLLDASQLNATVEGNGASTYTPAIGAKLSAGTQVLRVDFAESTNYLATSKTVEIVVTKISPATNWLTPSAITYGQLLSITQLNASVEGDGSATYTPSIGAKLTAGTHTLDVSFAESDNFLAATASVQLEVLKADPIINWIVKMVSQGSELGTKQLTATCESSGAAVYSPASGTVLNTLGYVPLTVTFNADENYNEASKTVLIYVSDKIVPEITWNTPTAIVYATALSGSQLNATVVNSPSAAVYTPALGTVLSVGNHILSVNYAGDDTHESVTETVTLNIMAAPLSITTNNRTKTYGAAISFAGTEFTTSGLVNGDVVTSVSISSLGASATSIVGSYNITPASAVGTGLANYDITYVAGSLTVNKAALTVKAQNVAKTYGSALSTTGAEFTTSALLNNDVVSSVSLASSGAAADAVVGTYDLTPSVAVGTGLSNYDITYAAGSLTINKANLTVTASNQSKSYGATITLAGTEFSTSGIKNTDAVTSVTLTTAGSAALTAVGTYAINPSLAVGSGLSNYNIAYVASSLTVSKVALSITANNQTKTYGSALSLAGTEFGVSGLKNADAVSTVTLSSSGLPATATVGSYAVTPSAANGTGLSNYTISYTAGSLTVSAATLTVTASNQSKVYGASITLAGTEFTTNGLKNSDAVSSVSLSSSGIAVTAAVASYAITPSAAVGTGISNYTVSYTAGTLTVSPAALIVTASSQTKTYGATLTVTGSGVTTTGLKNSDAVSSVTLTSTGSAATAAVSSYVLTPSVAVGTGLSNYTINYTAGTLTVSPAALTVTASNQTKTYGSTLTLAGTEFTSNGLKNSDAVSLVTLASAGTATTATVGSYAVTPSAAVGTGLSNYTISYTAGTLTVSPAALTVTANSESKVYGSALSLAGTEIVATGLKNSDAVSSATLASAGTATTANVGNYAVTPSAAVGTGLSNYTISYTAGSLTVSPAALTVTANNESKVYGSDLTLAGTELVAIGLKNSDAVSSATLASDGTATTATVGSYAVTPSAAVGTGLSNYTISYTAGSLTVSPAALTVTANNQSKVYGSVLTLAGTEISSTGLKNSDAVSSATLACDGTATTATVGSYAVTLSAAVGTGLSNYTILYTAGTLTVSPAALTVSANNQSKVYGSALTLAGTEIATTGLKNSDAVSSATLVSAGTATTATVGSYAVTPSAADGTGLSNYTISYTAGSLTVSPAALTVSANNQSKVYGSALSLAGTEFTATGLKNSDAVSSVTLASAGSVATAAVSNYSITPSAAVGSGLSNYTINYVARSVTVTKAILIANAVSTSKVYGAALPTFAVLYSGFANNESQSVISTKATVSSDATASSKVGTYGISASGASASNYSFVYVSATLTITKAKLTIVANDTTVQKDKTLPVFTYTVIGLVNDDTEATAFTGTPELTADVSTAKVGETVDIISALGTLSSDNYEFNFVSGTLTIIKNVKVSTTTAVDVAVYPNPAVSGNVSVKLASASKGTVSVISLGGAIIANKVIDSQLIDINVDALPVGTYYIRINTENGSVVKTLIKQ